MVPDVAFEVESTVETGGHAYVLARLLDAGAVFEVHPGTTLGGFLLEECVNIPSGTGAPGQRYELFAFCLHTPDDRPRFAEGDRVILHAPAKATGSNVA